MTPLRTPRPARAFQQTVSRTTNRLSQHKIALGLVVSAIGALLAWVAWASVNGVPFQDRYEVKAQVPADSPILQRGDAVRIAGRLAGLVTDVEPAGDATEISMELRPQYAPIGSDARANVRVKSLIYLTFLELQPGNLDDPMPEGGTIPLRRSGSGVDLLEVVQLFDREARTALREATYDAGIGLAGRGDDLNAALADVLPLARQGTPQLEALTRRPGAIAESIANVRRVARGLRGERAGDVAALIGSGSVVVGTLAGRSTELGESIELLRPLEDELLATAPLADPLLDDATALNRTLAPVLDDLAVALPDLNRTLALGDELRRQAVRLASFMRPVLVAATPVLRDLRDTVASIDPLLEPLGELVSTMAPYGDDVTAGALGLISATQTRYPEGQTAPDNPALRFAPVLGCHNARDPYPDPGETRGHSQPC